MKIFNTHLLQILNFSSPFRRFEIKNFFSSDNYGRQQYHGDVISSGSSLADYSQFQDLQIASSKLTGFSIYIT